MPVWESVVDAADNKNMAMVVETIQQQQQQPAAQGRIVGIKELVDAGLHEVPPLFVRPPHERPGSLQPVGHIEDHPHCNIPVIDLTALSSGDANPTARAALLQQLGRACEEWGFFQVVNHGVDHGVIEGLREAALRFFNQPADARMRFHSQSRSRSAVNYSISFNPATEEVRNWRDALGLNRIPGSCDGFLEAPEICKKEVQEYIRRVESLAVRLYKAIFESLGLDKESIEREIPSIVHVAMAINYYPPCPDPSLTLGLSSHSDVMCLTVLHPDVVPGLEIKHKDTWVPIFPVDSNAFVINLADQIEIMTNGKYKSIEHRVVTNGENPRMSIACFFGPSEDTIMAPLSTFLNENNPPRYKSTKFIDYFQNFMSKKLLPNRGTLDFARI